MYFDALTTMAMAGELQAALEGGRVQDIVLASPLALGLEVYSQRQRHHLLLCAETAHPRVHLTSEKVRRGPETPLPILLLLRKYVRGARLISVTQPDFERILRFDFLGSEGAVSLLAEIMGRRSNIILLSPDGVVMEAIKRVSPEQSRRPVQPNRPYEPPPPLTKASIAGLTAPNLHALLAEGQGPLWRRLVQNVAGVSPLLAREMAFRATGDAEAEEADAATLLDVGRALLVDLPATRAWEPSLGLEKGRIVAYAPYRLTHLPEQQPAPSMSRAIEAYAEVAGQESPYAVARARVQKALTAAREREVRRKAAIARGLKPAEEIDRLRELGEWVLAYATQIRPRQEELVVEDAEGNPLRIPLDPERSAVENAQRYFREYDNARAAGQEGPKRLAEVDRTLARLAQLEADLKLAENRAEIDEVLAALIQAGYLRSKKRAPTARASGPRRLETDEGFTIWVGRNGRQNAAVLERAAPGDLWLHARGVPGGHIILATGGREVSPELIERVAGLAAYYSAARDELRVPVDVAERRHVRPISGAGPGQVTYRNERTISVAPQKWEE